jgi:hypothetical protein
MYLHEDGITTWYAFEHVSTHMLKSRSSTPQKPLMSSWQPFSFGWLYVAKKLSYKLNTCAESSCGSLWSWQHRKIDQRKTLCMS